MKRLQFTSPTSVTNTIIHKLVLPALILITPFLVFLNYNSYCLSCAETWISLGGLLLLAMICSMAMLVGGRIASALIIALLITGFIDIQFIPAHLQDWIDEFLALLLFSGMQTFILILFLKEKFYSIATTVFLTFFIVTVIQLAIPLNNGESLFAHQQQPGIHAHPRIIHLILDEHVGIEGIPTDIEGGLATKNLITDFYLKNGFQLFGEAYSHYSKTDLSIPHMLNFAAEASPARLISGNGPYRVLQNKYFKLLSERDYRVEVLSPDWIDYCSGSPAVPALCTKKQWGHQLHNFAALKLAVSRKVLVLCALYLGQSVVVAALTYAFDAAFQSRSPNLAAFMSRWTWALDPDRTRTNTLDTLVDLKVLWRDIVSSPRGIALFAHVMIPHYPYVAFSDCSIRPPHRGFLWKNRGRFQQPPFNTSASRKERYQEYFEQLQCLYLRLDELFDRMRATGIYDDSIILIHGDHGSRIVMTEPTQENRHALTRQDLVDGFSTLFAMKLPGRPANYDKSPWPLEQLLAKFAVEAGLTTTDIIPKESEPFVYLTDDDYKEFIRIPYPSPNYQIGNHLN